MAELGLVEWDGAPRPAVLFRWSKRSGTIAIFSVITVGLLGVVGLATSRGLGDRLLASLLLLISLAGLIGSLGILWGTRFIALLPQGILKRDLPGSAFVAWDTIEAVGRYQLSWQSCLGLRTREPPRVEGRLALVMNRLGRAIRGMDGGFDVGYALWTMDDGSELERLVKRCVADPSARGSLGQTLADP